MERELKDIWKKAGNTGIEISAGKMIDAMKERMRKFDRIIRRRNRREVAAGVVVIAAFSVMAFVFSPVLVKIGAVIVVLSSLYIIYKILKHHPRKDEASINIPVRAFLQNEIIKIDREISLLKNVLWWYILPPLTGMLLMIAGEEKSMTQKIIRIAITVLIGAIVYFLNQHAVKKDLEPMKKDLEENLKQLEE